MDIWSRAGRMALWVCGRAKRTRNHSVRCIYKRTLSIASGDCTVCVLDDSTKSPPQLSKHMGYSKLPTHRPIHHQHLSNNRPRIVRPFGA